MIQQFCIKQNLSREVCEWFSQYPGTVRAQIRGRYKYLVYDNGETKYSNIAIFRQLTLEEFRKEVLEKTIPHVHAELIKKWADNPNMKIEFFNVISQKWELIKGEIFWIEGNSYREYDPYRELKEARDQGKIIQAKSLTNISDTWTDITFKDHTFSNKHYEYRIKPDKYTPFTFEDAENLIGKAVKTKCKRAIMNIVFLNKEGISLSNGIEGDYKFLFDNYTFLDGSPCGKLNK